jgi:hypothetical protein
VSIPTASQREHLIVYRSRGYTLERCAAALGFKSAKVLYGWMADDPSIAVEAEARAQELDPDAWSVLREAMTTARRDDGIDWPSRIAAARAALTIPVEVASPDTENQTVTLIVHRHADGTETATVEEGDTAPDAPEAPPGAPVPVSRVYLDD